MDRGAWRAIVHGIAGVRHNLATKPPPPPQSYSFFREPVQVSADSGDPGVRMETNQKGLDLNSVLANIHFLSE